MGEVSVHLDTVPPVVVRGIQIGRLTETRVKLAQSQGKIRSTVGEPGIVDALRGLLAGLDRADRAFLQSYWEGRSRYPEWAEKAIWSSEIRGHLAKQLEVVLPGDARLDQALRAYAQARTRALESGVGPGDSLDIFLWNAPPTGKPSLLLIARVVMEPKDLDGPVLLPDRRTESVTVYRPGERAWYNRSGLPHIFT